MWSWVDVNFKVLVNSEDVEKLRDTINEFLCKLNNTSPDNKCIELSNESARIGGVSSPKIESIHINDAMFEKILKKN